MSQCTFHIPSNQGFWFSCNHYIIRLPPKMFTLQGRNSALHIRVNLAHSEVSLLKQRIAASHSKLLKNKGTTTTNYAHTETFNIYIVHSQTKRGLWWKLVIKIYLGIADSRSPVCGWGFDKEEVGRLQSHTGHVHCGMYIVCKNRYSMSLLLQSTPHQEHDRLMDWWALASAQWFHLGKTELDDGQNQLWL